ncbi:hypothetical protein BH09BAC2_BH09BAC2_05250 [soil metagenome]
MKKILLSALVVFFAVICFGQTEKKNGTIYINHPYIDVVNNSMKAYLNRDIPTNMSLFADTATVWLSSMKKPMPIADALKDWATDGNFYSDIKVTPIGYPDYLHYNDMDQKYVQSWWRWSGKSKKTGQEVVIEFVQFDKFNKAGKIENEAIYGDFSKMVKE